MKGGLRQAQPSRMFDAVPLTGLAELVEAFPFFFTGQMSFWTYLIQCADRHFYVGHTDNLDHRLGQHQTGSVPGYTSTRLPVHLVWSSEFDTREEARASELQLKGWSRAKKLALIRGDWAQISNLASSKKEQAFDKLRPDGV